MTSPIEWQALPEDVGERLDRAIATHIPDMSRSYDATLVDLGAVEVNGSLVSKTSYKLKAGDTIRVQLPAPQPSGLRAEAIPLRVVYEDDDLLVVDKPAGMVVHP